MQRMVKDQFMVMSQQVWMIEQQVENDTKIA
jgi:hypothetical protein